MATTGKYTGEFTIDINKLIEVNADYVWDRVLEEVDYKKGGIPDDATFDDCSYRVVYVSENKQNLDIEFEFRWTV